MKRIIFAVTALAVMGLLGAVLAVAAVTARGSDTEPGVSVDLTDAEAGAPSPTRGDSESDPDSAQETEPQGAPPAAAPRPASSPPLNSVPVPGDRGADPGSSDPAPTTTVVGTIASNPKPYTNVPAKSSRNTGDQAESPATSLPPEPGPLPDSQPDPAPYDNPGSDEAAITNQTATTQPPASQPGAGPSPAPQPAPQPTPEASPAPQPSPLRTSRTTVRPATTFQPVVNITVPPTPAGETEHPNTNAPFHVRIASASGPTSSCPQTVNLTLRIQPDGSVRLPQGAQAPTLLATPRGETTNCVYNVTFPAKVRNLELQAGATAQISGASRTARATYAKSTTTPTPKASTFEPNVGIAVPANPPGVTQSPYAGTRINIRFTPASGSNSGCSPSITIPLTVSNSGQAQGGLGVGAFTLVDVPVGATVGCGYDVSFPAKAGKLTLKPGATTFVSAGSKRVRAVYVAAPAASTFVPGVAISVPANPSGVSVSPYAGTRFNVQFAPVSGANSGCTSSATSTLRVHNDGSVRDVSEATLIDKPVGVTTACVYTATFPAKVGKLTLQSGAQTRATAASSPVRASYVEPAKPKPKPTTTFEPAVVITVPAMPSGATQHPHAGSRFDVQLAPTTGSHAACTQSATIILAVVTDGRVPTFRGNQPLTLVDVPTGETASCVYTATFPAKSNKLVLQAGAKTRISAASKTARATYSATAKPPPPATTTFTPEVVIAIPVKPTTVATHPYSGTRFAVRFAPVANSNSGCTSSATMNLKVQPDGSVRHAGQSLSLVNVPSGQKASCVYTATFPAKSNKLVLQAGAQTRVSNARNTARASYTGPANPNPTTTFTPEVVIAVPVKPDSQATSPYAGTRFAVQFVPVIGARSTCSSPATMNFVVRQDGSVQNAGRALTLVNVPAGEIASCVYNVTFPAKAGQLVLEQSAQPRVSNASNTARARYTAAPLPPPPAGEYFQPQISISLPPAPQGSVRWAGVSFDVSFSPVATASDGCSPSHTQRFVVPASGLPRATHGSIYLGLINRPAGETTSCVYSVTFAPGIDTSPVLELQPGATRQVSAAAKVATAAYQVRTSTPDPTANPRGSVTLTFFNQGPEQVAFALQPFGSCSPSARAPFAGTQTLPVNGSQAFTITPLACNWSLTFRTPAGALCQVWAQVKTAAGVHIGPAVSSNSLIMSGIGTGVLLYQGSVVDSVEFSTQRLCSAPNAKVPSPVALTLINQGPEQVAFAILPRVECNPSSETPFPGTYTLSNGSSMTGTIFPQACNWTLTFQAQGDSSCQVWAQVKTADGTHIGPAVSSGSLQLTGSGNGSLLYQGQAVNEIEFSTARNCV